MMLHSRVLELTEGIKLRILLKALVGLFVTATYVVQAILIAQGIHILYSGAQWSNLVLIMTGIIVTIGLRAFLLWLSEVYGKLASAVVKNTLRQRLYAQLLTFGPGYLEKNRTGKIQSTLVAGIEYLEAYLINYVPQVIITVVGAGLIAIYIFSISPVIGLMIVAAFIVALFGPRFWNHLMQKYGWNHWQAFAVLNAQFLDSMQGITTLKAFNASQRRGQELEADSRVLCKQTMMHLKVSLLKTGIVGLAMTGGAAFAVGLGAYYVSTGQILLAQLFLLLFLCREAFRPMEELNKYYHQGFMGISASNSIFALLDEKEEVKESSQPQPLNLQGQLPQIVFKNVEFAYDNGKRPALRDVSFTIRPGEMVAIVGESGSGKSTIVNLLLRFFDPEKGQVIVGERDIKEYALEELRSLMAVVSQETYLFHGTVEDNLRMAKQDASKAEIEAAAKIANIHEFVMSLPEGYATVVGERGVRFSGGERQRMAIARAILKDAPILLLDEATSSIDAANEKLIQKGLKRLVINRTTLVIAHRLSSIQNAERILVFKEGQIVETGSHSQLMQLQGIYAKLVQAQQEGEERWVENA